MYFNKHLPNLLLILFFVTYATISSCGSLRKEGVLQFKSGFERGVRVKTTATKGSIVGRDSSAQNGINDWDKLTDYLSWNKRSIAYIQGGSMEIARDPVNSRNRVLHFHNTSYTNKSSPRTEWKMNQILKDERFGSARGGKNLFDQQFYRTEIFIPKDIKNAVAKKNSAPWYGIWESHSFGKDPRHAITLKKKKGKWTFNVKQQFEQDPGKPISWQKTSSVEVPFGEWFTLDVFFKYHKSQGEFYAAITRDGKPKQELGHYKGRTKFGSKIKDQQPLKLYHDKEWFKKIPGGTHQYYDDFEIWSYFPKGYKK